MPLHGGENAIVPEDAGITPPQAWVDAMRAFERDAILANVTFNNLNMETTDGVAAKQWASLISLRGVTPGVKFEENLLDEVSVDSVLQIMVDEIPASGHQIISDGSLALEGGTNAPPSAAGLANKATLIGRGWTVTHN